MAKKGRDASKKAALQAKKEAKADKAARKRLIKQQGDTDAIIAPENATLDELLEYYRSQDVNVSTSTSTMVVKADFPGPRANATFTLDEDNKRDKIYLFGGEYYNGLEQITLNHLLQYSISQNVWKQIYTPVSPPPRCAHTCVYYNHALYVFGGETFSSNSTTKGTKDDKNKGVGGSSRNNKGGGGENNPVTNNEFYHFKDLWKFDIKENTWTLLTPVNAKKSGPSPRSGHAAVVYKQYMIIFGGFYDDGNSPGRWYNDVHVLHLPTLTWVTSNNSNSSTSGNGIVSTSPLQATNRPEPRSAINYTLLENPDQLLIHGGFIKYNSSGSSGASNKPAGSAQESRVYTDAWTLNLQGLSDASDPTVVEKQLTWERLWSSTSTKVDGWSTPQGRAGMASLSYNTGRGGVVMCAFGGVRDKELLQHQLESVFYNDMWQLDSVKRKWFPVVINSGKEKELQKHEIDDQQTNSKLKPSNQKQEKDDSEGSDDEYDGTTNDAAWDVTKLRSSVFGLLDENGNVTRQNIDDDDSDDSDTDNDNDDKDNDDDDNDDLHAISNKTSSKSVNKQKSSGQDVLIDRDKPLPRINASAVVASGNTLILYGGVLEIGDREVTLDDMWSLDLKKRGPWRCIYTGSMHKHVWLGSLNEDDDSSHYSSTSDARKDSNDGNDTMSHSKLSRHAELEENKDSQDHNVKSESKSEKPKGKMKDEKTLLKEQSNSLIKEHKLDDENRTPMPDEDASGFYQRTRAYWDELDESNGGGESLAMQRFQELEPVLNKMRELHAQRKKLKDKKKSKKDKD